MIDGDGHHGQSDQNRMPVRHAIHVGGARAINDVKTHDRGQRERNTHEQDAHRQPRGNTQDEQVIDPVGSDQSSQSDGEQSVKSRQQDGAEQGQNPHRQRPGVLQFAQQHSQTPNRREEDCAQH